MFEESGRTASGGADVGSGMKPEESTVSGPGAPAHLHSTSAIAPSASECTTIARRPGGIKTHRRVRGGPGFEAGPGAMRRAVTSDSRFVSGARQRVMFRAIIRS